MGTKRTGTGQYVYFCIASLIVLSVSGCSVVNEVRQWGETRESLVRGKELLARGDYAGSLRENQRVLSSSRGRPPGDEALFNMGLIHSHFGNPKKDYKRALGFFKKLTKDYPQSPRVEQAKIFVNMLEENERLIEKDKKLNEMIRMLKEVDLEIEEKKRKKVR